MANKETTKRTSTKATSVKTNKKTATKAAATKPAAPKTIKKSAPKTIDKDEKIIPIPEDVKPENTFQKKLDYSDAEKILEFKHVKQYFRFKGGYVKYLKAVHDVSFSVYKGEVFGLVGESGCGKTTTGRDILKLYPLTSGDIYLEGTRISAGTRWNEKEIKWTNVRGKDEIKRLEALKKQTYNDINASYQKAFGENFKPNKMAGEQDPEKLAYLTRYNEAIAPIDGQIKSINDHMDEVYKEQMENIKSAKYDNKNYNKNIKEAEIKRVEEKYASIISKIDAKTPLNTEEEKEKEEYLEALKKAKHTTLANKVQMIFQDPIASLNPRMTVRNIIAEGLVINGIRDKKFINQEVARVLRLVGLVPEHANRYPHEFSGGQRQRIGIARAVVMNPELIVADEPVSALDVSVQAQVINLLNELRNSLGLTIVFIAHNLSVVKYFCDRIAVMYYGNLVELASSDELFAHPLHPYTKSLLSAVPYPDPITEKNRQRVIYDASKDHDYSKQGPTWRELIPGHFVRCNDEEAERYLKELKK